MSVNRTPMSSSSFLILWYTTSDSYWADHAAEVLLLRLGDPELVPGAPDVLGEVLPVLGLLLGGADEVVDVLEVDVREVGAPPGHRAALEVLQGLQPVLAHPVGLGLELADLLDDLRRQTPLRLEHRVGRVFPVETVSLGKLLEMLFLTDGHVTPSDRLPGGPLQGTRPCSLKSIWGVGFVTGRPGCSL